MNRLMKRYNKLILIRLFGELLTSTTGAMLAIIFIVYVNKALEGNVILTMLLFGLQPLTDIIFTLFAGGVTDRYGRKSIMLIGLCLQAIAMGGFVFAESVPLFALLYVINGIGRSLYIPAQRAQIADITEHEKQAEVFALIQTVGAIGTVIGPLIGYFFMKIILNSYLYFKQLLSFSMLFSSGHSFRKQLQPFKQVNMVHSQLHGSSSF